MQIQDKTFQYVFSKTFVYNILFEDTAVDERYLNLDHDSTVLSISGAGCGVAGMVSQRVRQIDAVDINPHHLALAGLKATAAQHLFPYSQFYDLCGRGWQPNPKETLARIAPHMPTWMQRHWKKHHRLFHRSMYQRGMTASMLRMLRQMAGLNSQWLRDMVNKTIEERHQSLDKYVAPILRNPIVSTLLRSPVQLVSLGINFAQRDRLLHTEQTNMVDYIIRHLKRVASTELATNWFAWYAIAGHYNHDEPDAVPPYLRESRYQHSLQSPTQMNFHRGNIFNILRDAAPKTWSHYTLCDAPDWLPPMLQKKLLSDILRTSRDGAIVLVRSVEHQCIAENNNMQRHFQLLEDISNKASAEDRSCQYRRVHFYRVVH